MSTERFEKLSKDKRQRILNAAREEFARVPYEEASINQIIKNAGISRGSFYTYFEDKRDLLQYIFKEEGEKNSHFLKEIVLENRGDFWKAITEYTRRVAGYMKKGTIQQSINILTQTNMMRRVVDWVETDIKIREETEKEQLEWMMEHLDLSLMDVRGSKERLGLILKSAHMLSVTALFNMLLHPDKDENLILREFNMQLELLRYGAGREARKLIEAS
ncbi:TetR/AcrR family transcriptional regulator [Oribacterium sp. FC2011]|uniref:TetR/AcrR family transcriptional regulator n=1 Tax=Oribacterium sp. FC2011 TaxID=1408311 RepID=UPI0006797A56|nr:TetR/AcrR family transcriptional regulator [Oribacterium sp. FC2011]